MRVYQTEFKLMKRVLIPILSPESFAGMPTKQLLGRLRALHECEESASLSDRSPAEIVADPGILFKDTAQWKEAHSQLKAVLAKREHVPSATERAKKRDARRLRH